MADKETNGVLPRETLLWKELSGVILSAVVLITLSGGAFVVTDYAVDVIKKHWNGSDLLIVFIAGSIIAFFIVIVGIILVALIKWPVANMMNRGANALNGGADAFNSATADIRNLQKELRNIGQIVLLDKFNELQDSFIKVTGITDESSTKDLRIIGTMMGTFGVSSLSLASKLSALSNDGNPPFKQAYFGVPGHPSNMPLGNYQDGNSALYPFAARVTAGKILLECHTRNWDMRNGGLKIHINFVPMADIFPAIQMWGDDCAMILSSAGTSDRMNYKIGQETEGMGVPNALPVAIVLKKETTLYGHDIPFRIDKTLERIINHLKDDYGLKEGHQGLETWQFLEHGQIKITNFQELHEREYFLEWAKTAGLEDTEVKKIVADLDQLNNVKSMAMADFEPIITRLEHAIIEMTKNAATS